MERIPNLSAGPSLSLTSNNPLATSTVKALTSLVGSLEATGGYSSYAMVMSSESFGSTFAAATPPNSGLFIVRDTPYSPAPDLSKRSDHFLVTSDEPLRDTTVG